MKQRPGENDRALRRTIERLCGESSFLAWIFAHLRTMEKIDDREIVRRLKMPPQRLAELMLCPRPRAGHFATDLHNLVREFQLDGGALASIIRKVDVFSTSAKPIGAAGSLLAARTRPVPAKERGTDDHPNA